MGEQRDEVIRISDIDLMNEARGKFAARREEFTRWRDERLGAPGDYAQTVAAEREAVLALLRAEAGQEAGGGQPPPASDQASFTDPYKLRLGRGRVLHLRAALKLILVDAVGLYLAYASASGFPLLLKAWFGMSLLDGLRQFKQCYERLSDPEELAVFEAVYELQNRIAVERKAQNLDVPFAVPVPENMLAQHLESTIKPDRIKSVLQELKRREVLRELPEGWAVKFW